MIFNSVTYVVFLVTVVLLYWVLPQKPRRWLLLLSGLTFYGFWRLEYIPVMLFQTVTDYTLARMIYGTADPRRRKLLLVITLITNLGLLAYFKYSMFALDNAVNLLNLFGLDLHIKPWNILLPLGISFYTFHSLSYTIDVYRGFIKPERDFVIMATFVSFFPQLVAGPILRAREVIPQLEHRPRFQLDSVLIGIRRILFGLFLKVVLADNIAPLVDSGFAQASGTLSALDVWTLAFLFGFQIYFDFSAYSHIAIGSALLMGIRFPENFNFPYMARSPRDFWRRWHISLSSWVRDYVYLPLTGSKLQDTSKGGLALAADAENTRSKTLALFLTWAIMGLWHGANWTFMIWGLYHASLIFLYRLLHNSVGMLDSWRSKIAGWMVTLPLVMLGWIFFRAETLDQAFGMISKVFNPLGYLSLGLRESTYLIAAALLVAIIAAYFVDSLPAPRRTGERIAWVAGESIAITVAVVLVFVYLRPISQFIYFQF
ncbi:MBOAT family O-acyltransferase [Desulfomonile tiedjei]|uniref:Putative membrane protein involved in D-alanine export n=1 Tax=Desulfomonile tiedjei (strain ATCC 49306 / DSM 6799 / DCB-1) TaxID=706587 RepID=I4C4K7_DESTA|nr:MBOAT family O-acyltransferase [Desulfomonile tiedjei]AFM24498.1 putative membrane protein involved in D-alanine export [Desulfomonile tiedjei DSM 6799]